MAPLSRNTSEGRFPRYVSFDGDYWERVVAEEDPQTVLELLWSRITFDIHARNSGTDEGTHYAELTADLLGLYMEQAYGDPSDQDTK